MAGHQRGEALEIRPPANDAAVGVALREAADEVAVDRYTFALAKDSVNIRTGLGVPAPGHGRLGGGEWSFQAPVVEFLKGLVF